MYRKNEKRNTPRAPPAQGLFDVFWRPRIGGVRSMACKSLVDNGLNCIDLFSREVRFFPVFPILAVWNDGFLVPEAV